MPVTNFLHSLILDDKHTKYIICSNYCAIVEPTDEASECPECGCNDFDPLPDEPDAMACSDCGLVLEDSMKTNPPIHTDWKESASISAREPNERQSKDQIRWSEQDSTAIVGLIKEPYRTYHEYYRIENPKKFFEGCSTEAEELQRIKQSDAEPFEILDLPHVEWRYSI